MVEEISHSGKVVEVTPDFVTVEIVSESACSQCHAASLCGMSEFSNKAVQVPASATELYEVGDEVYVNLKAGMGHKAVWLAYVLPLAVLVAVLLVLTGLGMGELPSALVSFGAVAVYYLCIWLLRDRLRNQYAFYIKRK